MVILQQLLIWLFGILAAILFSMALVSMFRHGSSFLCVSDKANRISHFYMLLAAIAFTFWFITYSPDHVVEGFICLLPMIIVAIGLSYGVSLLGRNLTSKNGIDSFKDKKQ